MPFDGLPAELLTDLAKLRVALNGVRTGWTDGRIGSPHEAEHCAIGWLLMATDWDRDAATRLAVEYVYPALPKTARMSGRMHSIYSYNDKSRQETVERLFARACALAEQRAVR